MRFLRDNHRTQTRRSSPKQPRESSAARTDVSHLVRKFMVKRVASALFLSHAVENVAGANQQRAVGNGNAILHAPTEHRRPATPRATLLRAGF